MHAHEHGQQHEARRRDADEQVDGLRLVVREPAAALRVHQVRRRVPQRVDHEQHGAHDVVRVADREGGRHPDQREGRAREVVLLQPALLRDRRVRVGVELVVRAPRREEPLEVRAHVGGHVGLVGCC